MCFFLFGCLYVCASITKKWLKGIWMKFGTHYTYSSYPGITHTFCSGIVKFGNANDTIHCKVLSITMELKFWHV